MPAGSRAGAFPGGAQKANQVSRRWPFLIRTRAAFGMGGDLGSAAAVGSSTVTATIGRVRPVSAAAAGLSTVAASLVRTRALTAAAAGTTSVSAAVTRTRALASAAAGVSTVSASIARVRALQANAAGTSTVTAATAGTKLFTAISAGTSTVTAGLGLAPTDGFFGAGAVARVWRIDEPQIDVLLQARAAGTSSVSCDLTKIDLLDRELEQLLALELIPA